MPENVIAYLALGGNLGDVASGFSTACKAIDALPQTHIISRSSLYRTKPWGLEDQPQFLNACIAIETSLPPDELLQKLFKIERAHGRDRERTVRWGPRPLDIDLLTYGDLVQADPVLTLPHPQLFNRAFVLRPLCEIAKDAMVAGRKICDAAKACSMDGITRLAETY
ncbi:MAG: 2-amino-4-hydroxy-6-hydroxymethyldihydropteridine diphosphokinase [Pseudomonadota bacterium]